MKRLGFGTMRMPLLDPEDSKAVDIEQVKKMMDAFLAAGFTYVDTAWMYHGYTSEDVVKEVLVDRYPRDSFQLATKLPVWAMKPGDEHDNDYYFNEQLRKTGAGYFDYYLLHGLEHNCVKLAEDLDCWNWALKKKEAGLIRHLGFSFHDTAEVLDQILAAHPEAEFVQLQINYLDWEDPQNQSRLCYETAVKYGKKVIVMEPVRGGQLCTNVPAAAEELFGAAAPGRTLAAWALRFVLSLPEVMVVLSGMSTLEQMEENIQTVDAYEGPEAGETETVMKAVQIYKDSILIPCTGCSYCTEGCPQSIPIPRYFRLYNIEAQPVHGKSYVPQQPAYDKTPAEKGRASDCIGCGQCEEACPQHLPVMENLKLVAKLFEG